MTNSPLTLLLFSAAVLIVQASCIAWWSTRQRNGQSTTTVKWVSLLLIAIQLLVFGVAAFTAGVSVVAQGTGLDEFTHAQMIVMGTVLMSAVGWLFLGANVHKLMK